MNIQAEEYLIQQAMIKDRLQKGMHKSEVPRILKEIEQVKQQYRKPL